MVALIANKAKSADAKSRAADLTLTKTRHPPPTYQKMTPKIFAIAKRNLQ